jgi:hypothetical protein
LRLFDGCDDRRPLTMSDGIGLAEALLGLPGFRVLEVHGTTDELVIAIETTAVIAWCAACGVRAQVHDRMPVRGSGSGVFWSAGTAGVPQATVAVPRAQVRDEDVD